MRISDWSSDVCSSDLPHAEAMALMQAGELARGATAYVTLEPCFHDSPRGPTCSHLLIEAGVSRVVVASHDPDSRTSGRGIGRLRKAGISVTTGIREQEAQAAIARKNKRLNSSH